MEVAASWPGIRDFAVGSPETTRETPATANIPPLLGLATWLLAGLAAGLLARAFLPGEPRLSWVVALVTGVLGALLGGVVATVLGFGGLGAYDGRSLVTAALAATLSLLVLRTSSLAGR